ncbi:deoxynucleotidyltransferase terminal-interacting protein 2 isoform X2 [Hetaerina americana]|uniref:deoxynucleotidyltransferase terminal-interacting protein 2 isoform X2 n=1 Tax=Hetaerina americana TaxID=62018 RepID=UPI003A7F4336
MDIVIDTKGTDVTENDDTEDASSISSSGEESESESEEDYVPETFAVPYRTSVNESGSSRKSKDADFDFNGESPFSAHVGIGAARSPIDMIKRHTSGIDEIMKKSVITPGFEKLDAVPPYEETKRRLIKKRREERDKTKGTDWFNLPAPDMTDELKHDLEVLRMRSVLDPKQFYKKNDLKVLPKYFQVGRVVEAPVDFYHSRIPKKQRKRTIVEELLADADFKRYNKRKFMEIIADKKNKGHLKAHKHSKKLKKKK